MIEFVVETEIARPVADVFDYATDPAKLATWQTNTVSAVAEDDGAMRLAQPLLCLTLRRQFAGYRATLKRVLES
jgi:hypothetical protein